MKTTFNTFLLFLLAGVLQAQPTANFTINQLTPDCSPVTYAFENGSIGTDLSYNWSFGDGQTSTAENPTHSFSGPAWFNICLIVTESGTGLMDTICQSVSIQHSAIDSVSISQQICSGEQIFIDGVILDESNSYHQFSYTNQVGCDSIVNFTVFTYPVNETYVEYELCEGEWVNVNGTDYGTTNPSGIEVLVSSVGCDSIIFIDVLPGFLDITANISGPLSPGGSVTLTPIINNGQGPFTYEWVDDIGTVLGSGPTLVVDQPGNYMVVVLDVVGCTNDVSFEVLEPTDLEIVTTTLIAELCGNENNGLIIIDVLNGTPPYTYNWSPAISTTNVNSNLGVGIYCVTVTDQIGNTAEACFEIVESDFMLDADFTNISCNDDGAIDLTVIGNNEPFSFEWSTGQSTEDLDSLSAGTYFVTVVDAFGCTLVQEFVITNEDFDYSFNVSNADCNVENGFVIFSSNNLLEYTFEWSDGGTGPENDDLATGGYTVTITYAAVGCSAVETFYVYEDPSCYAIVEGNVWNDGDSPDCMDSIVGGVPQVLVRISNGTVEQGVFTDEDGEYSFIVDEMGAHTITAEVVDNPIFELLCVDPIIVDITQFDTLLTENDFYLTYTDYEDVGVSLSKTNARPGFSNSATVAIYNAGAFPASGTASFIHPSEQNYLSASPAEDSYDAASRTVTWSYSDLAPGAYITFNAYLITPIGTALGTILTYQASTDGPAADAILENNMTFCDLEVTGSFDPNDKQVMPIGDGPEGFILREDSLLQYLVRFQNTGTDTAFTVVIRDTLDKDLDISSLKPLAASHSFRTVMPTMDVVEFIFEDIMLPDSFINEPGSNGFVSFSIQLKQDLPYGTELTNRAGIYFDFNEPVITNTVLNTIKMPNAIAVQPWNIDLSLTPNPADDYAVLNFELEEAAAVTLRVVSLDGKLQQRVALGDVPLGAHRETIDLNDLAAGVYVVVLENKQGRMARTKFVKM